MPLPEFDSHGDLPIGVHRASLDEVLAQVTRELGRRGIIEVVAEATE